MGTTSECHDIAERLLGTSAGVLLIDWVPAVPDFCSAADMLEELGLWDDCGTTATGRDVRQELIRLSRAAEWTGQP